MIPSIFTASMVCGFVILASVILKQAIKISYMTTYIKELTQRVAVLEVRHER